MRSGLVYPPPDAKLESRFEPVVGRKRTRFVYFRISPSVVIEDARCEISSEQVNRPDESLTLREPKQILLVYGHFNRNPGHV